MLDKENRVRKNYEFSYIYRKSKKIFSPYYTICVLSKGENVKVGFSVSKKQIGKAVHRNKIKRRLSEIMRKRISSLRPAKMIVQPKTGVLDLSFSEMETILDRLLKENNLYK